MKQVEQNFKEDTVYIPRNLEIIIETPLSGSTKISKGCFHKKALPTLDELDEDYDK
jgi:hypothetical protein